MKGNPGDPESLEEEDQSLVALAGHDDWLECICPEPCWCIHDRLISLSPDQEEADIGEEILCGQQEEA